MRKKKELKMMVEKASHKFEEAITNAQVALKELEFKAIKKFDLLVDVFNFKE